eukprot:360921-Chlamydomonas_euryale.AAC.2
MLQSSSVRVRMHAGSPTGTLRAWNHTASLESHCEPVWKRSGRCNKPWPRRPPLRSPHLEPRLERLIPARPHLDLCSTTPPSIPSTPGSLFPPHTFPLSRPHLDLCPIASFPSTPGPSAPLLPNRHLELCLQLGGGAGVEHRLAAVGRHEHRRDLPMFGRQRVPRLHAGRAWTGVNGCGQAAHAANTSLGSGAGEADRRYGRTDKLDTQQRTSLARHCGNHAPYTLSVLHWCVPRLGSA